MMELWHMKSADLLVCFGNVYLRSLKPVLYTLFSEIRRLHSNYTLSKIVLKMHVAKSLNPNTDGQKHVTSKVVKFDFNISESCCSKPHKFDRQPVFYELMASSQTTCENPNCDKTPYEKSID